MTTMQKNQYIWTDLRDFFFPRLCLTCGCKLQLHEEELCISCLAGLPKTRILNTPENEMESRMWAHPNIRRASSLFYYAKGGKVSKILHAMKYQRRKSLCEQMGRLIAVELQSTGFFEGIDYLIPVPLHPARLRQRGYNQSEQLCIGISLLTGIPLATDVLKRVHNNATQTHKSSSERWHNTQGLFSATDQAVKLHNKHVLFVDDVFTTGATLSACITALSTAESIQASIVTLAYAK